MQFAIRWVRADPSRHRSAHETFAANRRAPMMLAIQDAPQGMLVTFFIKPRATLALLAALMVFGYVAGGLGLTWWFARKPHNRIHAADIMLPWRWPALRDLRGQMFCAQGVEALKQREFGQGVFLIRRGLAAHPNEPGARLALAEIFAKARDYEPLRDVVMGQLPFPPVPRPLLELLVNEAKRVDDLSTIADVLAQAAKTSTAGPVDHRWMQLGRASALIELQQPQAALDVLAEPQLGSTGDVAELRVNALCALGRAEEAVKLADQLPRAQMGERERRLRLLAFGYRAGGRQAELAATLAQLIALQPAGFEPRIFAVEQFWAAHMRDEANRELEQLLERVSARPGAISHIVSRLGDDDAPALVRRCVDEARNLGQPLMSLQAALALAQVGVADWDGAEATYAAMFGAVRKYSDAEMRSRDWLRAVIDAGKQDTPKANGDLKQVLGGGRFTVMSYVRTAQGLARAGRWEAAQIIAEAGLVHFRRSVELQRRANEAKEKLAAQGPRKPAAPPAALPGARGPDLSRVDAAGFAARVNERLQREEWDAAAEWIAAVRRTAPPWLAEVEPELDWDDARIAFARDDRLRVVQAIGFALKRPRPDVERALGFAREFDAQGNLDAARAVARKVIEITPQSAVARQYLAELDERSK